jgi:2,3-bisphosphoglycerate-dependent phosphoglycerate mutase
MVIADPTQAVPQPTLRSQPDADESEILLIRHGRSADVVPGTAESADPPLHDVGVDQAARLDRHLAGRSVHAVYASHLRRAVDTARPIADRRGLTIHQIPDLEEVRLGDWSHGEFRRRAALQDPEWVAWSRTGAWDGIPGGEGDAAFRQRTTAAVRRIAADHVGQTVAVVAHGGTIGAVVAELLGISKSLWLTVDNTSVTQLRIGPHGVTVVVANDTRHLAG